jgi:broad specificity phosphatase PhoE
MRRIVLWRHGRTSWNADRRFQGQTDISLDDVGREQAANAARLLTGLKPTAIISSDLERAADTAAELSTLTGIPVRIDERLRETYAGDWEGMVWGDIESRYTDEMARWVSDPYLRPGGGETRVEVAARMTAAISEALAELGPDGTLVVTTHGGAARAGLGALLELPPEHWSILGVLTNCAWSVLVENTSGYGQMWRLQEYNAGTLPEPALGDDR